MSFLPVTVAVDSGGTVVLVSWDGIQRPPFCFPKGRHFLQFLSCLENGLRPHGQLDPPLWSQWGKVSGHGALGRLGRSSLPVSPHVTSQTRACPAKTPQAVQGTGTSLHYNMSFQGKVFPKLHKWSPQGSSKSMSSDKEDEEATDYMFRIIYPGMQSEFSKLPCPWAPGIHLPTKPKNDPRCLEREDRRSGRGIWDLGSLSTWLIKMSPDRKQHGVVTGVWALESQLNLGKSLHPFASVSSSVKQ